MRGPVAIAASLLALATARRAGHAPKRSLLVWINGDKGYNGLQKVGDAFAKESGVTVVVQHPEGAPDKFQAAAGAGKGPDIFCWPHDRAGEWAKLGAARAHHPSKACATRSKNPPGRPSPTRARSGATRWPSRPSG
jgi:maltose/maltodextrin transport system substrate-binding protein